MVLVLRSTGGIRRSTETLRTDIYHKSRAGKEWFFIALFLVVF